MQQKEGTYTRMGLQSLESVGLVFQTMFGIQVLQVSVFDAPACVCPFFLYVFQALPACCSF